MTRFATAAIVAALTLACRERARAVQGEAELKDMVHRMMPAVAEAARMPFKREPAVRRRSRAQVREYVIHKLEHDLPPDELNGAQAALRLFGLIPSTLDLRSTLTALFTEQIAGFYDPDSSALFIPDDVQPQQVRIVMAHELVHALQDQYARLDSIMEQHHQNDRREAAQAVLEGQATLVQMIVVMPEQKPDTLAPGMFWKSRALLGAAQGAQMEQFTKAPLWLRETMVFPYLGGADFMVWYRRKYFGRSVLDSLPISTEQIVDPDRYGAHDAPTVVTYAPGEPDTVRFEDDLGEFETRLLLQQFLDSESEATNLARGWDGDRYQVLGPQSDALIWYTVWDDAPSADRFAAGLQRAWVKRQAGETARRSEVKRLTVGNRPVVRLVDAPMAWKGWNALPAIRLSGGVP